MSGKTQIVSNPIHDRSHAREIERSLQAFLDSLVAAGGPFDGQQNLEYQGFTLPPWTRGVRVETTANGKQHVLVATEHRGH